MIDEIIDWYDLFNERERVEFSEKYVLPLELMLYDLLENKLEVEKVFPDKEKYQMLNGIVNYAKCILNQNIKSVKSMVKKLKEDLEKILRLI